MNIAIFANGVIENEERALKAVQGADLVIAADGGASHCLRLGVTPGLVIGDLDSLSEADQQALEIKGSEFAVHPTDKDETDLELALLAAASRNATHIKVLGAMGGRLDMTVANILLLTLPAITQIEIEFWHADQTGWLLHPPGGRILGEPGDTISLIPLLGNAVGITTRDLEFPLEEGTLEPGPARGVSNKISGSNPEVRLGGGALLIVLTPGELE